jgi:IS605 OrfB family transposase
MVYLSFKHEYLLKIVGNLNKIQNIKIVYSNGEISLHILYMKNWTLKTNENEKLAGMDAGINNLAALFINDSVSKSVIYSGENDIDYNVKSNRFIGKIQTSISKEVETYKLCKGKWYPETYTEKGIYLKKYVNFLFEKRHKHFYNEFHKISRRIVELLLKTGVSKLIISYNLGEMKNKGGLTMGKSAQKFFQIPIVKLIKYVEMKCNEVGIKIEIIDESYTSKTSCLSDDVNNPKPDNELNAVRSKRGLLTDKKLHQRYNADLGGAANHVKKYDPTVNYDYLHTHMFKLCNPVKITDDYDFTKYLKTL